MPSIKLSKYNIFILLLLASMNCQAAGLNGHRNFADNLSGFMTENRGQIQDKSVLYYGISSGDTVYFLKNSIRIALGANQAPEMKFINAQSSPKIISENVRTSYTNYYFPHCPNGILHVPTFGKIRYENLYPNIDMDIALTPNGMKYSFIVHPGGNVNNIQIQWKGINAIHTNEKGALQYVLSNGFLSEKAPIAYAEKGETFPCKFMIKNNTVSFETSSYFSGTDLVIDPEITWSTYFGTRLGTAFTDVCYRKNTNSVFVCGGTNSDSGISTPGTFQQVLKATSGNENAFIARFDTAGKLLWSTYYGAKATTVAEYIASGNNGSLYVIGVTKDSSGYLGTKGSWKNKSNGQTDIFISKWDTSGQRTWSTYYGGAGNEFLNGFAFNDNGKLFIIGTTNSDTGIVSKGALQTSRNVTYSARAKIGSTFICAFDTGGKRLWGTYYGHNKTSVLNNSITTDSSGNVYACMNMDSFIKGYVTKGVYLDSIPKGKRCPILMKLSAGGKRIWCTYIDTSGIVSGALSLDHGYINVFSGGWKINRFDTSGRYKLKSFSCAELNVNKLINDSLGNLYIYGGADSISAYASYPQVPIASYHGGSRDAFVFMIDTSGLIYNGTYIGTRNFDDGYGMALAPNNTLYACGESYGNGMGTAGSFQPSFSGGTDGFLLKLKNVNCPRTYIDPFINVHFCIDSLRKLAAPYFPGNKYIWSVQGGTIISGQGKDTMTVRWDSLTVGRIWLKQVNQVGCFDTTSYRVFGNDALSASFVFSKACLGDTVTFHYTGAPTGADMLWNFGDAGSYNNTNKYFYSPKHVYYKAGVYMAVLSFSDTTSTFFTKKKGCVSYQAQLINVNPLPSTSWSLKYLYGRTMQFLPLDTTQKQYAWYFGDGDTSNLMNPIHSYTKDSLYNVKLFIADSIGCSSLGDSTIQILKTGINPDALTEYFNISILPNPFKDQILISYSLPEKAMVQVRIYDLTGREITTLENAVLQAGNYILKFDAKQYNANAGVYIVRLFLNNEVITKQIVRIK